MREEYFVPIEEFPNYSIGNYGSVYNTDTERYLRASETRDGALKVGLVREGKQYTRSVKVLVAEAFVHGRTEVFDTPIHLDGSPRNVKDSNLVWRPRWFAWKYHRQFENVSEINLTIRVRDVESLQVYNDVYEAATMHGLLFKGVWSSIHVKNPAFPTGQLFEIVRRS